MTLNFVYVTLNKFPEVLFFLGQICLNIYIRQIALLVFINSELPFNLN